MYRVLLAVVLLVLLARAMSRLWSGIMEGATGTSARGPQVPRRSVQMARDPICGTFVVPDRSVTLSVGRDHLYFCSVTCRDRYRARTA